MRAIAGAILVFAASICFLASAVATTPVILRSVAANFLDGELAGWSGSDAPFFFAVGCIPFALGVYFLFSKDKPGA